MHTARHQLTRTQNVLLIPTRDMILADRCVSSFSASLPKTSILALVIYNGSDSSVLSEFANENVLRIGHADSERLATAFARIADCPKELLFGEQYYSRSYGGASNLLLAIGAALGANILARVDDDCCETRPAHNSWLLHALEHGDLRTIRCGSFHGRGSRFLNRLPRQTAVGLADYVYEKQERPERLGRQTTASRLGRIRNGNLVFSREAAITACYPVLFEPKTQTHLRGEIFFWKEELRESGFSFRYEENLELYHYPEDEDLRDWLRSLVIGFDFWHVFRARRDESRTPKLPERRDAISKFQSWILGAKWPEGVVVDELAALLKDMEYGFTDKILSKTRARRLAWQRLMFSELKSTIQEVIPGVFFKV